MTILTKTQIDRLYLSGERNFENINLANVDLRNSDLSFANLTNANLSGANLSKCNLKCVNLNGANLSNAILDDSDLSFGRLNNANLSYVRAKNTNFTQTHLNQIKAYKAYFISANMNRCSLNYSDLSESNMRKCNLQNAFLTGVNLTQVNLSHANLAGACLTSTVIDKTYWRYATFNQQTLFSRQFEPAKMGLVYHQIHQIEMEQLLNAINCISQSSKKYLGNSLVTRYLDSAKPKNNWSANFQIDSQGIVSYDGTDKGCLDDFQIQWYRQWIEKYYYLCSSIVNNFDRLIQDDLTNLSSFPSELYLVA